MLHVQNFEVGAAETSRRPVIASTPHGSGLHQEVRDCGIAILPGSPEALVEAVLEPKKAEGLRATIGIKARQRSEAAWCRESIPSSFTNKLDKGAQYARSTE